jgi:hypothetical protein
MIFKGAVGKSFTLTQLVGGRIVTTWFETDLAGAMRQLGAMPGHCLHSHLKAARTVPEG